MPNLNPRPSNYNSLRKSVHKVLLLVQMEIDKARVQTYWHAGKLINDYVAQSKLKDDHYGNQVVKRLAEDLKISESLLARCARFARSFNILAKWPKSSELLSWSHYRQLITVEDPKARESLLARAQKADWSTDELAQKIKTEVRPQTSSDRHAESSVSPSRPAKLIPKLGTLYTYRLIERESIHDEESQPSLLVDLGFQVSRVAEKNDYTAFPSSKEAVRSEDRGFKAGQIVESEKRGGLYLLRKSARTEAQLFTFKAKVERVVDGDTLLVEIDLGFGTTIRETLRLRGIDAPEMDTEPGKRSKAFVEKELAKVEHIILTSTKDDKYGRYLADVFYGPEGKETFLNQKLLDEMLAVCY